MPPYELVTKEAPEVSPKNTDQCHYSQLPTGTREEDAISGGTTQDTEKSSLGYCGSVLFIDIPRMFYEGWWRKEMANCFTQIQNMLTEMLTCKARCHWCGSHTALQGTVHNSVIELEACFMAENTHLVL